MNAERKGASLCSLVLGAVLLAGGTGAAAAAPPVKGQVKGAQLQSWLDSKAAWAGVGLTGAGCYYLSTWDGKSADGTGRYVQLNCPGGLTDKFQGSMRVVGDKLCSTFKFPDWPEGEECLSWHRTGEARFEQRDGELKKNLIYMLSVVPMPKK